MSRILIGSGSNGNARDADFPTLVSVIRGTSIVSLTDSEQFIELGLSEDLLLRIEVGEDRTIQATVTSTLGPEDVQPMRLQLIAEDEEPSAVLVAYRLHSLRQVYAIILLLDTGRQDELADALQKNHHADLEYLLQENERLLLQAGGPGSWWITAITKIKGAPQHALNGLSLIYGQGRHLLLERVQAATDIAKAEARRKEIENERLRDERIINLAKALDKTKDPYGRELILARLRLEMQLANPQLAAPKVSAHLPKSSITLGPE